MVDVALMPKVDAWADGEISRSSFNDLWGLSDAIAALWLLCLLGASICFIGWLHSAYANIQNMGAVNLRRTTGWAIGSWFIPLANLIWPKEIVNDTWRAGQPSLAPGQSEAWKAIRVPNYIHWWWACWLVGGALSNFGTNGKDP